jgi:hypothetical protein
LKKAIKVEKNAFQLWKTAVEPDDLEKLQQILPDSPIFKDAVVMRAELKDFSVLEEYQKLISQNPGYLHIAHNIWCEELQYCIEKYFESCKDNIPKDFKRWL